MKRLEGLMINLEEATRKAKEHFGKAGFRNSLLRLYEADWEEQRNCWRLIFEYIFAPTERLHIELNGETGEVISLKESMPAISKVSEEIRQFYIRRDLYWANALTYAEKGELRKASEMAWKAVIQALKALAASQGIYLETPRQLMKFARDLSQATSDSYFKVELCYLKVLYVNLYDAILDEVDFPEYLARAEYFIQRLAEKLSKLLEEGQKKVGGTD